MPGRRRPVGAPADVPGVRPRRLLRQLAEPARDRAQPRDRRTRSSGRSSPARTGSTATPDDLGVRDRRRRSPPRHTADPPLRSTGRAPACWMTRIRDRQPVVAEPGGGRVRILAVSDLHYRLRQFDWLLAAAPAVDAVMIAGDLLDVRSPVALDVQAVAVRDGAARGSPGRPCCSRPRATTTSTAATPRGRRRARWMAPLPADGVHVDCTTVPLGDDLVTVCPWWDGPRTRAALDACLEGAAGRPRRRWIWVHHAPPAGSPLAWDGRRAWGDDVLSGWIARFAPDLVLYRARAPGPVRARRRLGRPDRAAPGCSTPASRPARCRPASRWTWTRARRSGPRRRSAPRSSCSSRPQRSG